MNVNRYFFICSCVILAFSLMNYSLGPAINKKVTWLWSSYDTNCNRISDTFIEKQKTTSMSLKTYRDYLFQISECKTKVAMYNMEYISFNFNLVLGFICLLVSIYSLQEKPIAKSNLIGIVCGIIGFIITLIYAILNGIVFTNYYEAGSPLKMESDGAVAEYVEDKGFRCLYYSDIGNIKAFTAKYSDYIKSQYNYDKELIDSYKNNEEKQKCLISKSYSYYIQYYDVDTCAKKEYLTFSGNYEKYYGNCTKLYLYDEDSNFLSRNYDKYRLGVRFLIVLLFSIFMLPCYLALTFFGLKLSSDSSSYTQMKS